VLWPYALGTGTRSDPARIDAWIPRGARMLEHHAIDVPAEPGTALAAVGAVRLRDVPIVVALFSARGISYQGETTLLQFFGTSPFLVLEEEAGRELVFGVVGPFWRFRHGHLPPRIPCTAGEFRAALADGRMAAIGNFRAEPAAEGSRLWTETWVSTPALAQAIPFTVYWLLIGPFSAWIRRLFLRAARNRALARGGRDGEVPP
jgi:hypothetical protein